ITSGDDPQEFAAALDSACTDADLVVTAGAVSMGDAEVVRQVLGDRADSRFGPVAMQPGGPQGLAGWRDTPVVCLPGNPVSALVSFVVLLRPLLLEAVGREPVRAVRGRLTGAVSSPAGRTQYLRAVLGPGVDGERPTVEPVSGPGSHLAATIARADVLAEIPADVTELPAGAEEEALPLERCRRASTGRRVAPWPHVPTPSHGTSSTPSTTPGCSASTACPAIRSTGSPTRSARPGQWTG